MLSERSESVTDEKNFLSQTKKTITTKNMFTDKTVQTQKANKHM
jgi:hypothetical protein